MTEKEQKKAAAEFAKRWHGKGYEKGQSQQLELPYSKKARWIITCNFQEFLVYDMEKPNGEPVYNFHAA